MATEKYKLGVEVMFESQSDPTPTSELEHRLLVAASAILTEEGVEGLSLRKVADRAGSTTMAIYKFYGGKSGVLNALYREGFQQLIAMQKSVLAQTTEPRAVLVELCRGFRGVALRFAAHYRIMLGDRSPEFAPDGESGAVAKASFDTLVSACARFLEARGATGSPERLAIHLFTACHGNVALELAGYQTVDGAATLDEHVALLLDGFD